MNLLRLIIYICFIVIEIIMLIILFPLSNFNSIRKKMCLHIYFSLTMMCTICKVTLTRECITTPVCDVLLINLTSSYRHTESVQTSIRFQGRSLIFFLFSLS